LGIRRAVRFPRSWHPPLLGGYTRVPGSGVRPLTRGRGPASVGAVNDMIAKPENHPRDTRQALLDWVADYCASVGEPAAHCAEVLKELLGGALSHKEGQAGLLQLLGILEGLSPDPRTVSCAMLWVAHQNGDDLRAWEGRLPAGVRRQLDELLQLKRMESENIPPGAERSAEGLRRLLLALVRDVRVVLIALAWQLVLLRQARKVDERARRLAHEAMLIHAPLANRLGVWQLKWELEDLAFRYSDPEAYQKVASLVAERRTDRERFIRRFIARLQHALGESGIRGEVLGRPKHIYSIWRKMQRKGLDFHELFDVRAVRVLVGDVASCYSALGLVHTLWQPIPGEFDDYITTPKGNNYQSLHTAVVGPEGKAVEVQIRTREMHAHAELGVAAHWRYKEGGPSDPAFDKKIAVMRQLMEGGDEDMDDESLLESFQAATSEDRVYVLTPKGQVVDLVRGSTVLDFAYHIHTEVGHRCRGAKINGRIVPLTQRVETGQRVEILTGKHPRPSRDWLNPRLGYIRGARGRAKVRQWFRRESYDENLQQGRELVEAELRRLGLSGADLEGVTGRFSLGRIEDLFVAVGCGDLTVGQVVHAVERLSSDHEEPGPEELVMRTPRRARGAERPEGDDIRIHGVGNLMTNIARCCQPVPGDPVVGYVTRGRGVSIHREDCSNVLRWLSEDNPRLLQVRWGRAPAAAYTVELQIRAFDRRELIRDISAVLAAAEVNVTDISSTLDEDSDEVSIRLHARVRNYEQLSELLNRLGSVRNVLEARRLRGRAADQEAQRPSR
jgi:GTP pyrophosphokinase